MTRTMQMETWALPGAAAHVRRAVRAFDELPAETERDLELIASELATNAVRHAGLSTQDAVVVTIRAEDDRVRVEVEDRGRGFTRAALRRESSCEGGFGLQIVDLLAERWDAEPQRGAVWAELRVAS